jgi:hypothetical protein
LNWCSAVAILKFMTFEQWHQHFHLAVGPTHCVAFPDPRPYRPCNTATCAVLSPNADRHSLIFFSLFCNYTCLEKVYFYLLWCYIAYILLCLFFFHSMICLWELSILWLIHFLSAICNELCLLALHRIEWYMRQSPVKGWINW